MRKKILPIKKHIKKKIDFQTNTIKVDTNKKVNVENIKFKEKIKEKTNGVNTQKRKTTIKINNETTKSVNKYENRISIKTNKSFVDNKNLDIFRGGNNKTLIPPTTNNNQIQTKFKILKIYSKVDRPSRYNYQVNHNHWDAIASDSVYIDDLDISKLKNYDMVFLPVYKRLENHINIVDKIKNEENVKKILFDNDSYYRSFEDDFYDGFDYVFHRARDKYDKPPKVGSWLPWSVNTDIYTPVYGGNGISFNCTVIPEYGLRVEISKFMKPTGFIGGDYIKHLQSSGAGIHTNSNSMSLTMGKVVEFAACGCEIISNRSYKMNYFFPDDLIIYFDDVNELKEIIKNYKPNIEKQKELRKIVEEKHDSRIRANQIINTIKNKLF